MKVSFFMKRIGIFVIEVFQKFHNASVTCNFFYWILISYACMHGFMGIFNIRKILAWFL